MGDQAVADGDDREGFNTEPGSDGIQGIALHLTGQHAVFCPYFPPVRVILVKDVRGQDTAHTYPNALSLRSLVGSQQQVETGTGGKLPPAKTQQVDV